MASQTSPVPAVTAIPLNGRQHNQLLKLQGRESRRENARWVREGIMGVLKYGAAGPANGMYVTSVQVEGPEVREGVTYFRLRVHGLNGVQWHVLHRYSDFDWLRNQLGIRDKRVGTIFPQKTWFTSASPAEVAQRCQLLQIWVDGLIKEFATGGDGRNSIIAINRTNKLATLHSFFGIESTGGRLLENARLSESDAVVAWAAASAPPMEEPAAEAPVTEGAVEAEVLAPPMEETIAETAVVPEALEASADAAALAAELPANPVVDAEEEQFQAALAASAASHAAEEEARRVAEEEARLRHEEEQEARRIAEEEEARRKAEEELLETRRKMEEERVARLNAEEEARRAAEEEEARRAAEEEAKRLAEEEEARRKAEEEAKKPWLEQAVNMAGVARQFEDQGEKQQALDHYKKCTAMFTMALRKEASEKIRGAIQQKIADMTQRTEQLSAAIAEEEVARTAQIMSMPAASPEDSTLQSRIDALLTGPTVVEAPSAPALTPAPAVSPAVVPAVPV